MCRFVFFIDSDRMFDTGSYADSLRVSISKCARVLAIMKLHFD